MFELRNFSYLKQIYPFEWVMATIYVMLIMVFVLFVQVGKIRREPLYRYFGIGVFAKLMSAVVFCIIYTYYYEGGDTINYYESARAIVNLGVDHPGQMMQVLTGACNAENYSVFTSATGYPHYFMYIDSNTWFVIKLIVPILLVSFKSYVLSTIVLSFLSFFGAWKLFLLLNKLYPGLEKRFVVGMLFVPSVLFWGSGILKDTITFSAVCWFIYTFYWTFIGKEKRMTNAIGLMLSVYVLVSVKPYVLIALFPGSLIWLFHTRIVRIRSGFFKAIIIPFIFIIAFGIGYSVLTLFGSRLGKFSIEKMFMTASVTQNDLRQDYYHGSSFDIGRFDPTLPGVLSKSPAAMNVGLFRPFIWEARNPVMIISGMENFVYLFLALSIILRLFRRPKRFFGILFNQPFLLFLLSYSLIFSVLVGLSTSNFGALVRFKIPFLSSFVVLLLIMQYLLRKENLDYFKRKIVMRPGRRMV